jgi:hypothetical protein
MSYQNYQYYGQSVVTYPQIVMNQIQIIQKIYSKELKDGDKILKNAIGEQVIEGEDSRYSFLQAVEMFGALLEPYFIIGTEKYTGIKKEEFDKFCELLNMELVEMINDNVFKENVIKIFFLDKKINLLEKLKTDDGFKNQLNLFFLNYKIKEARRVFRRLIKLFEENDFLTTTGYNDSESEDTSMIYDETKDGSNFTWDED